MKKTGLLNNKNAEKKISAEDVRKLAERFWTKSEIAAFFNCSEKTIYNRFTEIITKGRENGKANLRDVQLKSALAGNVTMLIWLGKQYLNQTDKQNTGITLPENISIQLPEIFNQVSKEMQENI